MALKIRLARGGAKKKPFYRIVVAENTAPRDGLFIEKIGTYNPMVAKDHPQRLVVQEDRVKHWLSVGARPTDRVHKFLASLELMPAFEFRDQPKKSAPGKKRVEREAEAAAKAAAAAEAAPAEAAAAEAAAAEAAAAEAASAEAAAAEAAAAEAAPAEAAAAEAAPAEAAPAEAAPAEAAPAEAAPAEEDKSSG
jgi:small subunit ribosomal protein S16